MLSPIPGGFTARLLRVFANFQAMTCVREENYEK